MSSPVNLVVFDVDGTLLDNLVCEDECYTRALRDRLGLHAMTSDWSEYEHVSDEGIAIEAFRRAFDATPSREVLSAAADRFVALLTAAHAAQPIRPVSGAVALLQTLPSRGWAVALATGAWRGAAVFKLTAAGIPYETLPIATAEDGPARTDIVRAAWLRAEHAHHTRFDRVVAVGDGAWDVEAARMLTLPFVGRGDGAGAERLQIAGARVILSDFRETEDVITALESATTPSTPRPNDS